MILMAANWPVFTCRPYMIRVRLTAMNNVILIRKMSMHTCVCVCVCISVPSEYCVVCGLAYTSQKLKQCVCAISLHNNQMSKITPKQVANHWQYTIQTELTVGSTAVSAAPHCTRASLPCALGHTCHCPPLQWVQICQLDPRKGRSVCDNILPFIACVGVCTY